MTDNKARACELVDVVFNQHDLDGGVDYFTQDQIEHNPWPGFPPTIQGFKDGAAAFIVGFPDLRCEVDDVLEDGDKVIIRSRMIGTNSGSFMCMPATGKRVEVEGNDIDRMRDGRMAEHWGVFDGAGMMQGSGTRLEHAGVRQCFT